MLLWPHRFTGIQFLRAIKSSVQDARRYWVTTCSWLKDIRYVEMILVHVIIFIWRGFTQWNTSKMAQSTLGSTLTSHKKGVDNNYSQTGSLVILLHVQVSLPSSSNLHLTTAPEWNAFLSSCKVTNIKKWLKAVLIGTGVMEALCSSQFSHTHTVSCLRGKALMLMCCLVHFQSGSTARRGFERV